MYNSAKWFVIIKDEHNIMYEFFAWSCYKMQSSSKRKGIKAELQANN